ncbi:alpha beta hydrolase [Fusarium tjaetaba]|uniref:Alpha beta hydrolase n=1 Tax=Fusarium tjaetaba TaxID=1567544 RepID=A0A8H5S2U7_9HYPO|nr:alpha beta hydrolase [Fusarium tjaetaba]KAF5645835.1 alpha beta hydrolase [Fusarium tjaetaba]
MYHLHPVNAAFAARIASSPSPHETGNCQQAFDNLEELQKHKPAEDIQTETLEVSGKYGPTTVALVRSKSLVNKSLPIVFYLHGGGYMMGSAKSFAVLLEDLARRTGATIVFPEYTRVPYQTFPYQFRQSYEVLEHIVQHASQHQLLAETIALAGDSAGARIGHLLLWAPTTTYDTKLPSHETFKNAPFLSQASMKWMHDSFIPNEEDRKTPLASPLGYIPDELLAQFPPTVLFLSTVDPLVDEGVAFGNRLQKAGVDAAIIKAEGQLHSFCLIKETRNGPTARAVMDLAAAKLKTTFSSGH